MTYVQFSKQSEKCLPPKESLSGDRGLWTFYEGKWTGIIEDYGDTGLWKVTKKFTMAIEVYGDSGPVTSWKVPGVAV